MKKLILICLVASLLPAAFGAQIIKGSEFDYPYAEWDATSGGAALWWGDWNFTHTWGAYMTGDTWVGSGWGLPFSTVADGSLYQEYGPTRSIVHPDDPDRQSMVTTEHVSD